MRHVIGSETVRAHRDPSPRFFLEVVETAEHRLFRVEPVKTEALLRHGDALSVEHAVELLHGARYHKPPHRRLHLHQILELRRGIGRLPVVGKYAQGLVVDGVHRVKGRIREAGDLVEELGRRLERPSRARNERADTRVDKRVRGGAADVLGESGDLDRLVCGVGVVPHVRGLRHVAEHVHRLAEGAVRP